MREIAAAIARAIGWNASNVEDDERTPLTEVTLYMDAKSDRVQAGPGIRLVRYKDGSGTRAPTRITVRGVYPYRGTWGPGSWNNTRPRDWLYGDPESPDITVSAARTPEQIAADVARRFLPGYMSLYCQCQKKAEEARAYELRLDAVVQRVRDVVREIGGEVRLPHGVVDKPHPASGFTIYHRLREGGPLTALDVRVSTESVRVDRFEVSSIAQFERVLRALSEAQ